MLNDIFSNVKCFRKEVSWYDLFLNRECSLASELAETGSSILRCRYSWLFIDSTAAPNQCDFSANWTRFN